MTTKKNTMPIYNNQDIYNPYIYINTKQTKNKLKTKTSLKNTNTNTPQQTKLYYMMSVLSEIYSPTFHHPHRRTKKTHMTKVRLALSRVAVQYRKKNNKRHQENVRKNLKVVQDSNTDMRQRLARAESTWEMAENLYRTLAETVRDQGWDIKDLSREVTGN